MQLNDDEAVSLFKKGNCLLVDNLINIKHLVVNNLSYTLRFLVVDKWTLGTKHSCPLTGGVRLQEVDKYKHHRE